MSCCLCPRPLLFDAVSIRFLFPDEGLKAHASASVIGDDEDQDVDDPLCDDMSRLSVGFDDETVG